MIKLLIVCGLVCMAVAVRAEPDQSTLMDVEEDPVDRFLTTRSGKLRPSLVEPDWDDEDVPLALGQTNGSNEGKPLSRKKRCNDNDRGGNANRARRAQRAQRVRRRRNRPRNAAGGTTTTTTITRKLIRNGQVVSQTSQVQPASTQTVAQAPVVVHQQQPPATVIQQQPATVVQQQQHPAATVIQQQPATVVQQQQPATVVQQQQPAAAVAVPSIAVQGSIKVN